MSELVPFRLVNASAGEPYLVSEHARVLKGFLRPFKGKGDFELWQLQLHELADELRVKMALCARRGLEFGLTGMPLYLYVQRGREGRRRYLRWRSFDNGRMGFSVLVSAATSPAISMAAKHELMKLDAERIVLNMQLTSLMALTDSAVRGLNEFNRLEALRHTLGEASESI